MSIGAGTVIAHRYRVVAPLGEGGYGAVYAAVRLADGQPVALKLMHARHAARGDQHARFERESRLLVELEHPHVVRTLDFGYTDDELPFIAFEKLEGRTLRQELDRLGALDTRAVLLIVRQVLLALDAAGQLGIVHRDIKPANIFLLAADDTVKMLDFGLAKPLLEPGSDITTIGQILGSPCYIAPEQIRAERVDQRADIYAVGLVTSELVSGQKVVFGGGELEIFMAHVAPEPHALPLQLRNTPLGDIVARAIHKDPEARYPSAAAMLADIDAAARAASSGAAPADGLGGTITLGSQSIVQQLTAAEADKLASLPDPSRVVPLQLAGDSQPVTRRGRLHGRIAVFAAFAVLAVLAAAVGAVVGLLRP